MAIVEIWHYLGYQSSENKRPVIYFLTVYKRGVFKITWEEEVERRVVMI